jgi:hypothetical protein
MGNADGKQGSAMSDPLRHIRPVAQNTSDFLEAIIPSSLDEYTEQLPHLQELRIQRGGRKLHNILMVGAGDGKLAQMAIQLLAATDLLDSDLNVDVIENDDALWHACASRLTGSQEREIDLIERVTFCVSAGPVTNAVRYSGYLRQKGLAYFELPSLEGPLLIAVEQLGSNYDLIIASHITYYFPDTGVTLAYFLASRCLKSDGIAWFVVRDRDCGVFKLREELLHEASLPDVNHDHFSDSFFDGIRCLVDSDIGIRVSRRRTNLRLGSCHRRSQENLIKCLMGLDGLPVDLLSRIEKNTCDFSESHIWIEGSPYALRETGREAATLHATDTITRCMGIVRMVCQDAQVLRVSLATYTPTDDSETPLGSDELLNINKPLPFPQFRVRKYGFTRQHRKGEFEEKVLKEYFRQHNSFVYFRRFFLDYYHASKSYAFLRRLGSLDRLPEIREIHMGSCDITEAPVKEHANDDFSVALEDWHELLERYYCGANSPTKPNVWTISIGCRLLRTQARDLPLEHDLNFGAGFFFTWATSRTFEDTDAAKFVGQIKTRISQYLARQLFKRFQQKTIELKKSQRGMGNLIQSLRNQTDTAADTRHDAERLRAVLFEPADSLFGCYPLLAPFFSEGSAIRLSAWIPPIHVKHTPAAYKEVERKILFAGILSAIFGKQEELRAEQTVPALFVRFSRILTDIESSPAYEELLGHLRFVIGGPEQIDIAYPHDWQAQTLNWALDRIQRSLIVPFKFETLAWPSIALQLAQREPCIAGANLVGELREDQNLTIPPWTPIPYNAVIAFTLQFCRAWRSAKGEGKRITALSHKHATHKDHEQVVFSIEFSTKFVFGDNSNEETEKINCCRNILTKVVSSPRDWQIDGANCGELMRPLVTILNHTNGVYAQLDPNWEMIPDLRSEELFKMVNDKNEFFMDVEHKGTDAALLRIVWRTTNTK